MFIPLNKFKLPAIRTSQPVGRAVDREFGQMEVIC